MSKTILTDYDFGGVAKPTNLPTPSASGDAAPKGYVDSAISAAVNGLAWKDAVRVASVANVTVASPGAAVDGVTLSANDRVLLKDQSAPSENGVYVFNGAATPMTRASDFDATTEIEGAVVPVEEGTANTGTRWFLSTVNPTIGGTLTFTSMAGAVPTASTTVAGIVELATQGEVDAGTASPSNLVVTPATLLAFAGRKLKASGTIGDGAATQIDVTHNLNTKDLLVQLFRVSDDKLVEAEVTAQTVNITRFNFAAAPALNALRYEILG